MEVKGIKIKQGTIMEYIINGNHNNFLVMYPTAIWKKIKEELIKQDMYDYATIIDVTSLTVGIIMEGEILQEIKKMKNYKKLYKILVDTKYIIDDDIADIDFDDITWIESK